MSFASCALLNRLLPLANSTVSVVEMSLCALASSLSSRPTSRNGYRYREFFQGAFEQAQMLGGCGTKYSTPGVARSVIGSETKSEINITNHIRDVSEEAKHDI